MTATLEVKFKKTVCLEVLDDLSEALGVPRSAGKDQDSVRSRLIAHADHLSAHDSSGVALDIPVPGNGAIGEWFRKDNRRLKFAEFLASFLWSERCRIVNPVRA